MVGRAEPFAGSRISLGVLGADLESCWGGDVWEEEVAVDLEADFWREEEERWGLAVVVDDALHDVMLVDAGAKL